MSRLDSDSSIPPDSVSDSLPEDEAVSDLLREIAHVPSRNPPREVPTGVRWGADGRYEIDKRLGRGGMGTVYAATDTLLGRSVALKVLDEPQDDEDAAYRDRLLREARLAAQVEHERIARVYDVGDHEGALFVAMEYVRGATLRTRMGDAMAPAESLALAVQIAEGLAALHASGIVHRDLKPENVMFTSSGDLKLLDFGLARQQELRREGGPGDATAIEITVTAAVGTPGYMAPEQWTGPRVDARADVFALGVILYELIFAERPFRGPTALDIRMATLTRTPSLTSKACSGVVPPVRDVLRRCLAVPPEARFENGAELLQALREALMGLDSGRWSLPPVAPESMAPAPVTKKWPLVVALSCGALAVLLGLALAKVRSRAARLPPPVGMVRIEGGKMRLGRSLEEIAAQCQEIGGRCEHPITERQAPSVTRQIAPFYLDVNEVTNAEMAELLESMRSSLREDAPKEGPARFVYLSSEADDSRGDVEFLIDMQPVAGGVAMSRDSHFAARPGREDLPAVQVSWFGANFFCVAKGKRLPTEDEWEAAARGTEDRTYPWGDSMARCQDLALPNDGLIPMDPSCPPATVVELRAVGTSPQDVTPEGVHDLGGNVGEWTDTDYAEGGREARAAHLVPLTPRVIRGGSFGDSQLARTSMRNRRAPNLVGVNVGFRCAADVH